MRTLAIATAVALSGFIATGAEDTTNTTSNKEAACCATGADQPCCQGTACADNDETEWVDIETITIEAANGDPIAQYIIAYVTDTGTGDGTQNPEKAQEMYKNALPGLEKAAANGNPRACRALAYMYAEGKGVKKDEAKAREYMEMCKKDCAQDGCKAKGDTTLAPEAKSM